MFDAWLIKSVINFDFIYQFQLVLDVCQKLNCDEEYEKTHNVNQFVYKMKAIWSNMCPVALFNHVANICTQLVITWL